MCGIAGWIDWENRLEDPVNQETLTAMIDTLKMRGPDDSGRYVCPNIAFGHRRLSVVDPANGAQPMIKRRNGHNYVITYNGELYNTNELRAELEGYGQHC